MKNWNNKKIFKVGFSACIILAFLLIGISSMSDKKVSVQIAKKALAGKEEVENRFANVDDIKNIEPDLSFGLLADAHVGQSNGFSKLENAMFSISKIDGLDFIMELGDFVENRSDRQIIDRDVARKDLKKANDIVSRNFKLYSVLGNHDVFSLSKEDNENISGEKSYYLLKSGDYQIIVLDTNFYRSGKIIDVDNKNKIVYGGFLPDEQLEWLEDQLKKSDKNIIFSHHPFYALDNKSEVEKIISDNKEAILFIANGHRHPEALREGAFGGAEVFGIPSLEHQDMYGIVKIFEDEVYFNFKKIQ